MENSFFKFNTTLPPEDDERGGRRRRERTEEDDEEEYDALNDETFGSAINVDWEDLHENLVRLNCMNGSADNKSIGKETNNVSIGDDDDNNDEEENSDLEINLSCLKLDDVDVGSDDNECRTQLDPSVWANPIKTDINQQRQQQNPSMNNQLYHNPENYLRQHFSSPFENMTHAQPTPNSCFYGLPAQPPTIPSKICTVEDIERNIRFQQQQQQQQQQHQQQQQQHQQQQQQQQQQHRHEHGQQKQTQSQQQQKHLRPATPKMKPPIPVQPSISQPQSQTHPQPQPQTAPLPSMMNGHYFNPAMPPGFNSPRPNFAMGQHPLNVHPLAPPQSQHRMPPGFPPMPMMAGHQMPPPHHQNFPRALPHNLPIALNNFAMHPNFNAMRPLIPTMPPPRHPSQPPMPNQQNLPNNANQFNQRLMQEIQQNHPMLANVRGPIHPMFGPNNHPNQNQNQAQNAHQKHNVNISVGNSSGNGGAGSNNGNKINIRSNGNVHDEYDDYSNLMSTRDKHWLIAIQLSQLNTDTPYIDDYYYTVYKERKAKLSGDSQSKAHKDNQLNHPLTQPKGHAKLVLISMGKNGTNRNGQNRERKNSGTKNDKETNQRTYTPLQFENSLGKLQYGSVTAPRKIIDMEIMGADGGQQFNTSIELSAQRKSRQILLHIETLYKILLELEDLHDHSDIVTQTILKANREKEKQLQQQQQQQNLEGHSVIELGETSSTKDKSENSSNDLMNSSLASDQNSLPWEIQTEDKLIQKLIPLLTMDKIIGMMNVRKGKTLIRRIMPFIEDNPIRWNIWIGVFTSLQTVLKKDKDDNEGTLFAIYPEFKKQIALADFETILKISNAMPLSDKKLNSLFTSKFCISSLVALLLRAEQLYSNIDIDKDLNDNWSQFLSILSSSLNRTIQHQTISAAIESDAIQPLVNHFSRFKELKLDPLLTLFSEAKQQID